MKKFKAKDLKKYIPLVKQYRFHLVGVIGGLLLLLVGLSWWNKQNSDNQTMEAKQQAAGEKGDSQKYVQVFKVKGVHFQDVLPGLMGTVRGSSLELKGAQDEKLNKYHFKSGDFVKRGTVIAEQDHTRTHARLVQAQINLKRKQALFDVGGASQVELDEAQEVLNIAKKDYEDTFIAAPKDGYLGEVLLQEGELVNRQTPVLYFVSTEDSFVVETSVIERRVREIKVDQKAQVTIDSLPGVVIDGRVMSVSPEVTTTSRMAPVKIELPVKYRLKLRPGLSAVCSIVLYDRQTPVIPKTCLVGDKEKVYVVDGKKQAHIRDVRLGYEARDYVEVLQGLNEGEIVVNRPDYAGAQENATVRFGQAEEYKEGK
ncbi:MAG: efflux RND transporter periplasmic adaptor subunit [Candidatus Firestonebacteria bacterium]|nr:efflux RND transporter periplasmic adaptor subunit [Candidatus Firestonebacteria bacterium]